MQEHTIFHFVNPPKYFMLMSVKIFIRNLISYKDYILNILLYSWYFAQNNESITLVHLMYSKIC